LPIGGTRLSLSRYIVIVCNLLALAPSPGYREGALVRIGSLAVVVLALAAGCQPTQQVSKCAAPALVLGTTTYSLCGCAAGYRGGANRPVLHLSVGQSLDYVSRTRRPAQTDGLRSSNDSVLERKDHSFLARSPGQASIIALGVAGQCNEVPPSRSQLPLASPTSYYGHSACYLYEIIIT
jgi:hypothetical protein